MNTNGSVANGNGRKKTNSDAKTLLENPVPLELKSSPKTPEEKAEELKEVAKHFIGLDLEPTEQPEQITPEEPEEELDAEELLRQSKKAETADKTAPIPEEEVEETEESAITKASDAIAN
ncbi:MAG: hypothetical protein U7127_31455 (plasmid) [Phormidium sp.]